MKRTVETETKTVVPAPAAITPGHPAPRRRQRVRIVAGGREHRPERPGAARHMRGLFVLAARRVRPTPVQDS